MLLATTHKPRRRPKRIPRQLAPKPVELAYFSALKPMVERMRDLVRQHVEPKIPRWLAAAHKDDAEDDADYGAAISYAVEYAQDEFYQEYQPARVKQIADQAARRTSKYQREQLQKQMKAALGIDVVRAEPWLKPKISAFTRENVSLIKSIPQQYFSHIESTVIRSVRSGRRHEDIAEDIEERYEVSKNKAKLIARDQVSKFNGELNEARQTDLGITHFVWRTAGDDRVRPEHVDRDGERYSWDDTPKDDNDEDDPPGHAINCRCTAEPDVSGLLESLGL